jgi:hypothetical protein
MVESCLTHRCDVGLRGLRGAARLGVDVVGAFRDVKVAEGPGVEHIRRLSISIGGWEGDARDVVNHAWRRHVVCLATSIRTNMDI